MAPVTFDEAPTFVSAPPRLSETAETNEVPPIAAATFSTRPRPRAMNFGPNAPAMPPRPAVIFVMSEGPNCDATMTSGPNAVPNSASAPPAFFSISWNWFPNPPSIAAAASSVAPAASPMLIPKSASDVMPGRIARARPMPDLAPKISIAFWPRSVGSSMAPICAMRSLSDWPGLSSLTALASAAGAFAASMPAALNRLSSARPSSMDMLAACIAGAIAARDAWLSAITPPNFWWSAISPSISPAASSAVMFQASRMSSKSATAAAASWPVAVAYLRNFAVALSAASPMRPRSLWTLAIAWPISSKPCRLSPYIPASACEAALASSAVMPVSACSWRIEASSSFAPESITPNAAPW